MVKGQRINSFGVNGSGEVTWRGHKVNDFGVNGKETSMIHLNTKDLLLMV
jgi:hypothetical protein